ncbi:hypothetical protein AMTR_s00287p00015510 [Amborella trichopoda]|uniref:Uncharacterized protein n=1 Tax=Amborella trichopoda TaxID=13333 RepID=W1PX23_AMBTC|nr:hypothetical protein AMTR_s00287p00015510 [Amborella trichopoda]
MAAKPAMRLKTSSPLDMFLLSNIKLENCLIYTCTVVVCLSFLTAIFAVQTAFPYRKCSFSSSWGHPKPQHEASRHHWCAIHQSLASLIGHLLAKATWTSSRVPEEVFQLLGTPPSKCLSLSTQNSRSIKATTSASRSSTRVFQEPTTPRGLPPVYRAVW